MLETNGKKYNPLTRKMKQRLGEGQEINSLVNEFGKIEVGRSFALLTTFENKEDIKNLAGEPASDLKILCDVNFSYNLTQSIYEHIGIPHFTFSERFKDKFFLSSSEQGAIRRNSSDQDLYAYARQNKYDAILSCDSNLSGPKDLCWIARDAFQKNPDTKLPSIIILSKTDENQDKFIQNNGSRIIQAIQEGDNSIINYAKQSMVSKNAQEREAGQWLKNYLNQHNFE